MARMTGFVFQDKYLNRLAKLTDQEVGRLVRALAIYHARGEEQELKGRECGYYDFIKADIDEIEQRYTARCETNRNNRQRTSTNVNEREQSETNAPNININKNIKDTLLKESTEKRKRFTPPTVEEVDAYCKERGNKINPQTFVDFYEAKGWKVGNNPMKDWKACVRTWEQRDGQQSQQKPRVLRSQDYEQREYHEAEMRDILGVDDLYKEDAI